MTPTERKEFIAHLQATALLFRRRLNDDTAAVYANALPANVPFDALIAALDRLARSAESTDRFPLPRELGHLARGAWHGPARQLTDGEADAVRQRVFAIMATWERTLGTGSAQPAFKRAWEAALKAEGIRPSPQLAAAREATWQAWLKAGAPLTAERKLDILADVAPRCAPGLLLALRAIAARAEGGEPAPEPPPARAPRSGPPGPLAEAVATVLDIALASKPAPTPVSTPDPTARPSAPAAAPPELTAAPAEQPVPSSEAEPEPSDDGPPFTEF